MKASASGPSNAPEIILLGAGASVAAGVPTSYQMTEALLSNVAAVKEVRSLATFILGQLLARKGILGEMPIGRDQGVDVEEFVNAVQLLRERESLELSAFIGTWHPHLEKLVSGGSRLPLTERFLDGLSSEIVGISNTAATKRKALDSDVRIRLGPDLRQKFQNAVREVVDGNRDGELLIRLERDLIEGLVNIAWTGNASNVEYLRPLLGPLNYQDALAVASLNYDNCVELLAESSGVQCSIGLDKWSQEGEVDFSGPGVHLIKLHGSIDWRAAGATIERRREGHGERLLIFGGRNKLTAKGPFLDLLASFRGALRRSRRLTVVGYSFRDGHVNEYISRWLRSAPERRLRVVDPYLQDSLKRDVQRARELHWLSSSRARPITHIRKPCDEALADPQFWDPHH